MDVDVTIIGAGPGGSTLAALLGERGVRVALVDRDTFPRDKLCGEFLSYDALPILDAMGVTASLDDAGAAKIGRCRIVGGSRSYEIVLPHQGRGISRLFLDDLLLRTAAHRGALRFDGWTATLLRPGIVTIEREGETREVRSKAVVGAWGRWGRFDTLLKRRFVHDRAHRSFGFKRHYRGSSPRDVIELHSFGRGYLGVNAIEGDETNICGLVHASRLAGHKGRWEAFIAAIRDERRPIDELYAANEPSQDDYLSSEPVIFRARSAVEQGVFMIGDASGIVDPLAGNGMAMAIQSAMLAAPHLVRLLQDPRARPEIERDYADEHDRFFAPRIRWSRGAARILSSPRLLDAALATIRSRRAGGLFLSHTRASRDEVERLAVRWFC